MAVTLKQTLSPSQIRAVRRMSRDGVDTNTIARAWDVSPDVVEDVANGKIMQAAIRKPPEYRRGYRGWQQVGYGRCPLCGIEEAPLPCLRCYLLSRPDAREDIFVAGESKRKPDEVIDAIAACKGERTEDVAERFGVGAHLVRSVFAGTRTSGSAMNNQAPYDPSQEQIAERARQVREEGFINRRTGEFVPPWTQERLDGMVSFDEQY